MLKMTEQDSVDPICPHCDSKIKDLWYRELGGMFGKRYIYFCSACKKTLGVSHRKGFWMG